MADISSLMNITSNYISAAAEKSTNVNNTEKAGFDSIFQSAMDMVSETNALSNQAELEEIKFAMGESESTHDLTIALQKAETAIQYTVAFRDKVLEAYREIMNMQF